LPHQERKLSVPKTTKFKEDKQKAGKASKVQGQNQVEGPFEQDFEIEGMASENFEILGSPSDIMKS
jgi:hypothetical protein